MLDIIGNIKISPTIGYNGQERTIRDRIKFFKMVIESEKILNSGLYVNIANVELKEELIKIVDDNFKTYSLTFNGGYFNNIYIDKLNQSNSDYILHFEEDHVLICQNINYIEKILKMAKKYDVDLIKATFNKLENESYKQITPIYEDDNCKVVLMNNDNQNLVTKTYKYRYFIGVNCIYNKRFAYKFWDRELRSFKPHPFELPHYNQKYEHIMMIPKKELLCPIDDDHGVAGSCVLNRINKCIKKQMSGL